MAPRIEESGRVPDRTDAASSEGEVTVVVGDDGGARPHVTVTPRHMGRYLVVEQIGAGGMGRVLRAYDPKLHREVALKLVAAGTHGTGGSARIVREAQAMARLSHPNLVPVYDVEQDDDEVFIAMEYVIGETLREWMDRTRHPWPEVLDAFLGAGRGLAAAHAAGVVHRDFKPSNAIVASTTAGDRVSQRVRVMDFGLARGISAPEVDGSESDIGELSEVTQAGTIVGTPPYMAPEQHKGGAVVPASDQYAFCVALYEGLYGVRPFTGADMPALIRAKLRGVPETAGATERLVPQWLRATVVRGLAADPGGRWPTMDALLGALERGQARARRRQLLVGAAALAVVGVTVALVYRLDVRQRTAACEAAGATIDEVWNDDARVRLRDALVATGVSYAGTTAANVMPWIDRHAAAWRSARTEACLDADLRERWDADMLDRSLWCLDERRIHLEALLAALSSKEVLVVQRAVSGAAALASVDACRDEDRLRRLPPPPAARRDEVRDARIALSRVDTLERGGRFAEGLTLATATREHAESLGWPPLAANASFREAVLFERLGNYESAQRAGSEAYFAAADAGAWDVAARAAIKLIGFAVLRARHAEGLEWSRHARTALAHAGDPEGLREASRLHSLGSIHHSAGEHQEALAMHERALAIQEHALGPDHPDVASTLTSLANAHLSLGRYAEARELYARALAILESMLGPDHPDVAVGHSNVALADHSVGDFASAREGNERALAIREHAFGPNHPEVGASQANLANVYQSIGDGEKALALFERALVTFENALGPDHPDVAGSVANLAVAYYWAGDYAQARTLDERALAIHEKSLGPDHPYVASDLANLALVDVATGDLAGAKARLDRAQDIRTKALGPEHPEVAGGLALLGFVASKSGDHEGAKALYERALAMHEKALGPDHVNVAQSLTGLADAHAASGDHPAAMRLFERALAIFDRGDGFLEGEGRARLAAAKALVAAGGDRARARRLAEQARDGWRAAGTTGAKRAAEADAWLVANP